MTDTVDQLTVLSFRKIEDVKRLARHFQNVINHPLTQDCKTLHAYLRDLDRTHKNIILQKRDGVEVEYIFTTEKKSNLQRQRFNSLPVSEVPELLKVELSTLVADKAKQVHICTDCNIEIELNDEVPLEESLEKHFNSVAHLPKLKRESIDVSEPVILPNMSRRLSAMSIGDSPLQKIKEISITKSVEKLDRNFSTRLSAALVKILPDASEASVDAAMKFYQENYDKLCSDIANIDFSTQTTSVAPIIMSIKDNVYQNFAADANKNIDNDENEQNLEKPKNQAKKYRYYGPIEALIVKLLVNHKLISLIDDRTGKLAFFCIACEYYTLRFHYDSVLNHVFSGHHVHNLSCILQSDKSIPISMTDTSEERIKEMNDKFLLSHDIRYTANGLYCRLCSVPIDSTEASILHILDEKHLAKLSDELYVRMKESDPDRSIPEEWGPKDLNWTKYLASVGKPHNNRDHVIIENFIKPSGKIGNFCLCCDMTLKGPRQVLFNHIRQKKHLRNAAPRKLSLLYKNHCRPSEYFASFGNFYVCTVCPDFVALPSISAIVEHFESYAHFETLAKLIRSALYNDVDEELLLSNKITADLKCSVCDISFQDYSDAIKHILGCVDHQTLVGDSKVVANKGDIISVYMKGNYILHTEGATFRCVECKGVFQSIRALLSHLVYAGHFKEKPSTESVFRFYLELKHNINMLSRNKYDYYEFGCLKCGVCEGDIEEGETAKKHVVSPRHRENMGASYVSVDTSAVE